MQSVPLYGLGVGNSQQSETGYQLSTARKAPGAEREDVIVCIAVTLPVPILCITV